MHRILRGSWPALMLVTLAASCGEDAAGPDTGSTLPDGVLETRIVRNIKPDEPFFIVPFPADPAPDSGEEGSWRESPAEDDFRDESRFAILGEAYFESPATGEPVPFLVQIGASGAGASVRVVLDQVRGTLGIFGLKDHSVWVTFDVYRLR